MNDTITHYINLMYNMCSANLSHNPKLWLHIGFHLDVCSIEVLNFVHCQSYLRLPNHRQYFHMPDQQHMQHKYLRKFQLYDSHYHIRLKLGFEQHCLKDSYKKIHTGLPDYCQLQVHQLQNY